MRPSLAWSLVALSCLTSASEIRTRDYDNNDYYVLQLDSGVQPAQVAVKLGLTHEGQLGELIDHHIFSTTKNDNDVLDEALSRRKRRRSLGDDEFDTLDTIRYAQKQKLKPRMEKRGYIPQEGRPATVERQEAPPMDSSLVKQMEIMKELDIADPIFKDQWHLYNPVQPGHDVNVTEVWKQGITGHNATVAIVDDGLDMYSDDLKGNYYAEGSYDFNDRTPEPKPRLSDDRHGTRCAGEVAAVKNNVCGVGVAWDSKVAGIRILSKLITDADEAVAMNYAFQHNQIYSCSWGPPDDGKSMDAPGILIKRAMLNAVQNGRGGKGSIYVFASGNGAANDDNCNFDGYTNSIYSITVGAVDRKGLHPYYSEKCSAQLVVTYSSGSGDAIHTTDVGTNTCASQHGGTSAAAPLAAGIFALVLSIRPDLTWRDMQYLVMQTALPIDVETGEWQDTTIGKKYSHTFGYGKIDSWATVEAAKAFKNVKPQAWFYSPWMHIKQAIPQGDQGLSTSFEVTADMLKEANLERLEHVTVTMNVNHGRRGDLSVDLVSPNKVISHLSAPRRLDSSAEGYQDWTFMSVIHWGESGIGTWTVVVKDTQVNDHNGTFVDWKLKLWGESIDPSKAAVLPMPEETDDDDHDATTTVSATTIIHTDVPVPTAPLVNPTDGSHPDRPINAKPSDTEAEVTEPASAAPTSTSAAPAETTGASSATDNGWLPSFFPTFGVSARTLVWIYGSLALIVVFCSGLGVYFWMARRKRIRNSPRDEYEFDLIQEDEAEGLNSGKKGGKRRAGELYDAFAAGSEEEFSDDDDDAAEGYRDRVSEQEHHVIGDDEDEELDEKSASKQLLSE